MSADRGRKWAPLALLALAPAIVLSALGSVAHAAVPSTPPERSPAVTCAVFIDSPLVGVPGDMVYGPDGRIWFTETGPAPTISALHPSTNAITRFSIWDNSAATPGKGILTPHGITVGPDGAIWFTGITNNRIGRITTSGALSFYPPLESGSGGVPGDPGFMDIAGGSDGNLWITARNASSIYRLTPSGTFTAFATGVTGSVKAWGIAAAPDGTMWFAAPGSAQIVRFTPGPSPVFTGYDVAGDATNIVVDGTGSVWFTMPGASRIGRLVTAPVPVITTVATPTGRAFPDGITIGADGGVWFTERAVGQIGRADPLLMGTPGYEPSEHLITLPDPSYLAGPGAIVGLRDGTVWFGEEVRKIAHFTGTAAGVAPLPPQATVAYKDGPAPVIDPSTGTLAYSTTTVLEVRAASQGLCIDQIRVEVAPCATGDFVTILNVSSATASFQLPDDGCWTIRVTVSGPGGTAVLPDTRSIVDDSLFPDTVEPVITVPADIVVPATSSAGAAVTFEATASDNEEGVTVTCTPPSGSVFTVGTTTVECVAVDAAGNDDSATFTVTVTVPPPTITVPADLTVPATGVTTPVRFTATGHSIVNGRLPVTCVWPGSPPQTSVPSSPTYGQFTAALTPLLTTITCTATDLHGQSARKSFTVNVTPAPATTIDTLTTITAVSTLPDGRIEVTVRVAFLNDPSQVVPAGRTVVIGTTTTAGTVTATIGADGTAVAILPALAPGEYDITARFGEQRPYLASEAATRRGVAAQATSFVIWGGNAGGVQNGQRYQFWGAQWSKQVVGNTQDFRANSSFMGWGGTVTGTTWSTKGGNASEPKQIASYITVIVTTRTEKDGAAIRGNVSGYAVLRVEDPARYAANPGHSAFGRVVQTGP